MIKILITSAQKGVKLKIKMAYMCVNINMHTYICAQREIEEIIKPELTIFSNFSISVV